MRSRSIKPGFYDNELLGTMSPLAHLLFPGLWQLADHEGRLEYRPLRIKAKIFPYRDADVDSLCDELESAGMIVIYANENGRYLYIPEFKTHQRPHPNEKKTPSELPPFTHQGVSKDAPNTHQGTSKDIPNTHQGVSKDAPNRAGSSGPSGSSGSSVTPLPQDSHQGVNPAPSAPPFKKIHEEWNTLAKAHDWEAARQLTQKRKVTIRERWRNQDWREHYHEAMERLKHSSFVRGSNDRGWKAGLDWFLRPDTLNRILEGKYDDRDGNAGKRDIAIKDPEYDGPFA